MIRVRAEAAILIQAVQTRHILVGQGEVEDVDVLAAAAFANGLRNGYHPVLQIPTENDLRRRFAVFVRKLA